MNSRPYHGKRLHVGMISTPVVGRNDRTIPETVSRAFPSSIEQNGIGLTNGVAFAGRQDSSATVGKIEDCVEKLRDLGFEEDDEGGIGQLVMYAQAAEGNLSDAIDIIDGVVFSAGHHNPSTVNTVQECIEKLTDLGFGEDDEGGIERLTMCAQAVDGNLSDAIDMIDRVISADEHSDSAIVEKIRGCVNKLQDLGFGGKSDEGVRRLVVYAQAAEGSLSDAIDMIDEEQRAYQERSNG